MPLLSAPADRFSEILSFLFRVLIGFLFLQHGLDKLGLLNGQFGIQGLMGFIGVCELLGGIAILLGVWVRLVALLGMVLLISAYVKVHMPGGVLPINNGGELALLFVAAFLVLFKAGAGKWSLERVILGRETF